VVDARELHPLDMPHDADADADPVVRHR
jgi:hypothetical protein